MPVVGSASVRWDQAALDDVLKSADGPVGRMLIELSDQVAQVARNVVPVRNPARGSRGRAGRNSTAHAPGYTKALIRPHLGRGTLTGNLYGGANAPGSPGIFLEYPAEQMTRQFPFLTTGLDSLAGSF
jgi:hypothetical protein